MAENHNNNADEEKRQDPQDDNSKNEDNGKGNGKGEGETRKRPGKKPLIILGIVVIIMVIGAIIWWFMTRNLETTDDAFIEGDAVTVAPKVAGYVTELRVKDNQRVKKGDLLVVIDPRDATAQRDQAQAQLSLAESQLHQAQAQLALAKVQYPAQRDQAKAQVLRAQAELANARAEYQRQRGVDPRATSKQNIDAASAQLRSAEAGLANAQAQLEVAEQVQLQIRQQETNVEARQSQVEQARAQLQTAELNLSYTEVRAPFDGYVTKRNVQNGTLVQAGSALFSIVSPDIWIVANFKESQLERMRPGNKVEISVDAFPDLELEGHVESIQQGSGSRFSAFPAENATGNFVKIVQRVPVKIVIDKGLENWNQPLPLGLSVEPEVTVE
ncbi:HlyD family secretion protein [Cronobacter malonaticus]|uniref:HlyD family secretion protein n=3 Tax=Cronobacter malonaticus TaxID=413503 RepID=V5U156_9ENTR|nr:HlyD family secretion protein [Cronobacter malonaticus]CCJ96061.1 Membrane fusion component of tripartite multidrug resistance system [Cronobacter malonaticus 681]AHB71088.1 multidrug resistance protein K [Cronobacter malonaticus]ALX79264.1 multidrug export protein EmrA [Cronobacter malonaticus LMG 23826]EGT4278379.1 HlyD family secretion protein [Cronobacter malonaticus]EGT4287754.1 HlyD family secretion protein [Cronobacter malonaticus]